VDAVLLSHPMVGEAVSFAAPDSKYGEEVRSPHRKGGGEAGQEGGREGGREVLLSRQGV